MLYVDNFKPTKLRDVCGNKNIIKRMNNWIQTFGKKSKKGFLIWGCPGIGKTTVAHLICKENNLIPFEYNSSDIRTKKKLEQFLNFDNNIFNIKTKKGSNIEIDEILNDITKEEYSNHDLCDNILNDINSSTTNGYTSIKEFEIRKKFCIIMDEIDGISENKTTQYIIKLLKETKVPIILICNENPIYGKFKNVSSTLKKICNIENFVSPPFDTIYKRIEKCCIKEGLKHPSKPPLKMLYLKSNGDIRYIINQLQFNMFNKKTSITPLNIFKESEKFFNKTLNFKETTNKYFENDLYQYFIQENYIKSIENRYKLETEVLNVRKLKGLCKISELISESDQIKENILRIRNYSLMPVHAYISTVIPSFFLRQKNNKRLFMKFPSILRKIPTINKNKKLLKQYDINDYQIINEKLMCYNKKYNDYINEIKNIINEKKIKKIVRLLNKYEKLTKMKISKICNVHMLELQKLLNLRDELKLLFNIFSTIDQWKQLKFNGVNKIQEKLIKSFFKHEDEIKKIIKKVKTKRTNKKRKRKEAKKKKKRIKVCNQKTIKDYFK
jgi:replication factor C subunit 1